MHERSQSLLYPNDNYKLNRVLTSHSAPTQPIIFPNITNVEAYSQPFIQTYDIQNHANECHEPTHRLLSLLQPPTHLINAMAAPHSYNTSTIVSYPSECYG